MVLVHAHPDDETITCGGTMARAVAAGVGVTLVTCTLGELGEVIPAELAHLHGDDLGAHRAGELDRACAALGITDHRYLGGRGRWHDSGMVATGDGIRAGAPSSLDGRAFAAAEGVLDEQVAQLTAVLREVGPRVVVSYDATGGYGHPDHVRAHDVTAAAVAAVDPAGDTVALHATAAAHDEVAAGLAALRRRPSLPLPVPPVDDLPTVPDPTVTTRVGLGPARAAKLDALRAHATQVEVHDDGDEPPAFALSNRLAQPVLDAECFVHLRGPAASGDDLFPAG